MMIKIERVDLIGQKWCNNFRIYTDATSKLNLVSIHSEIQGENIAGFFFKKEILCIQILDIEKDCNIYTACPRKV